MNHSLSLYVLASIILLNASSTLAEFCGPEPDLCDECRISASCKTLDAVIPQTLPRSLTKMTIKYIGSSNQTLSSEMFERYSRLTSLTILGSSIRSLEEGAFQNLLYLESLSIIYTGIKDFPNSMLPQNLTKLDLSYNHLQHIPYQLFDFLPKLKVLSLSFNPITLPTCYTIGAQFARLISLQKLQLAGASVPENCKTEIPETFFEPIQTTVSILDLTITNLFDGSKKIFQNFVKLKELHLSLSKHNISCPSKAVELFQHLPNTTETLIMRRWRMQYEMIENCSLTNISMAPLKNLPRLTKLDMSFGDHIFGKELKRSIFFGFKNLATLNIRFTQFSSVEDYAFDGCQNLTSVDMGGNCIGHDPIKLFQNRSLSKLQYLGLSQAYIYSDFSVDYNAVQILLHAPLKILNLNRNFILKMPYFINNQTSRQDFAELKTLYLDENHLTDLETGGNLSAQCTSLYNLKTLSITNNKLQNIAGICCSITTLNLASNKLGWYWDANENVISHLEHLQSLDISYNQIKTLSINFAKKLTNLKMLSLKGNNLTAIDPSTFISNHLLRKLDFQDNQLTEFNYSHVHYLHHLEELLLQNNRITFFDKKLILDYLDNTNNSIKVFGINGNPFQCSCDQQFFQDWIKNTSKVPFANRLECSGITTGVDPQKVYSYKRNTYVCDYKQIVTVLASVLGGIIGAILVAFPGYKYRWYLFHLRVVFRAFLNQLSTIRFEQKCTYDAYVMYNSASDDDLSWVVNELRVALEGNQPLENSDQVIIVLYIIVMLCKCL